MLFSADLFFVFSFFFQLGKVKLRTRHGFKATPIKSLHVRLGAQSKVKGTWKRKIFIHISV